MAHKTLIDGTLYSISGGKTLEGGTAYSIVGGKTLVDGSAYNIDFPSKYTLRFPHFPSDISDPTYYRIKGLKITVKDSSGNAKYTYDSEIYLTTNTVEILSTDTITLEFQPIQWYESDGNAWLDSLVEVYQYAGVNADSHPILYNGTDDTSGSESGKGYHVGSYTLPLIRSDIGMHFSYKNGTIEIYVDMIIS